MKKSKLVNVLLMLALTVAGLVLIVFPGGTLHVAVMDLGIALICYGLFSVISYFVRKQEERSAFSLLVGVLSVCFGAVVVIRPGLVENFFPTVVGGAAVVLGVSGIARALKSRKSDAGWKSSLGIAAATAVLGLLLFFVRLDENTIVRMLGILLLYVGISGLAGAGS